MARIAGVDLPKQKRGEIGLTYIYGIGPSTARYILDKNNIDRNKKVNEWNDDELNAIRSVITDELKVEGQLRSEVQMSINVYWISLVTVDFVTVKDCRFVDSVLKQIAVPVKENVEQLPVKRRLLRNNS